MTEIRNNIGKVNQEISEIENMICKETDVKKINNLYETKNQLINKKLSLINILQDFNKIFNYDIRKENKPKKRKADIDLMSIEEKDIQTNEDILVKKK